MALQPIHQPTPKVPANAPAPPQVANAPSPDPSGLFVSNTPVDVATGEMDNAVQQSPDQNPMAKEQAKGKKSFVPHRLLRNNTQVRGLDQAGNKPPVRMGAGEGVKGLGQSPISQAQPMAEEDPQEKLDKQPQDKAPAAKPEPKVEAPAMGQPKPKAEQQPQDKSKEMSREEPKVDSKEEPNVESKEIPKVESKETPKEESKENTASPSGKGSKNQSSQVKGQTTNLPASKTAINQPAPEGKKEKPGGKPSPETFLKKAEGVNPLDEAGGVQAQEIPAPELNTENSDAVFESLTTLPPIEMSVGMHQSGPAISEAQLNEQSTAQEDLPELMQPTGLGRDDFEQTEKQKPDLGPPPPLTLGGRGDGKKLDTSGPKYSGKLPGPQVTKFKPADIQAAKSEKSFSEMLDEFPSSDPEVDTNMGPRPEVDLSGDANPEQNKEKQQEADDQLVGEKYKADVAVYQDFGEGDMYPTVKPEMLASTTQISAPPVYEGQELEEVPPMSAEMQTALNPQLEEEYGDEIQAEREKQDQAQADYEAKTAEEQAKGMEQIENETANTKAAQKAEQDKGKADVDAQRTEWRKENEQVKKDFEEDSKKEREDKEGQIDKKIEESDSKVETEYGNAEKKSEDEKIAAEDKVEKEKKKAEEEDKEKSWWDRAIDAVADFFNKLKELVTEVFTALRDAVKGIIEAAKKVVGDIIDAARDFVVGMIKAFAEVLKAIVSVALAAFPELADKFCKWIDEAVEATIAVIDALAQALKDTINALLDVIGAVLDAVLAAMQAYILAYLSVLEFLVVGIIKILRGIVNLGLGIGAMPGHFMGQLSEEALGTDVTQPLKGIERTENEEKTWKDLTEGAEAGVDPGAMTNEPGMETAGQAPANVDPQNETLLNKSGLSDGDVALDGSPDTLDPDLMDEFSSMEDGQEQFMPGSDSPVTTEDLQSSVFGGVPEAGGKEPEGSGAPTGEMDPESMGGVPEGGEEEKMDPNWPEMTDDQKLQYHINSMGDPKPAEMDSKATGESSKEEMPEGTTYGELVTKTGRLGVGQRLSFVGQQMMKGMEMWWSENQVAVYLAIAGILIVGGIIAFFTGGAGLIALLQILMEVLMYYFIATAIMRIKDYLWQWADLSWNGNPDAGGKALARALAILIAEFVLEYVLKVVGKVLAKLKAMMKATRTFRKFRVGMHRTMKTFKAGTGKFLRKIPGAKMVKNATAKGGKYMVNIGNGFAKGAKRFEDFRQRVLKRFGFKKFKIVRKGKWFQIWGEMNPWVLLANGKIRDVDESDIIRDPKGGPMRVKYNETINGEVIQREMKAVELGPSHTDVNLEQVNDAMKRDPDFFDQTPNFNKKAMQRQQGRIDDLNENIRILEERKLRNKGLSPEDAKKLKEYKDKLREPVNVDDLSASKDVREGHHLLDKGTQVPQEVATQVDHAQNLINDLNRTGAKHGDGSSAFIVIAEQVAGGVDPKAIVGVTKHLDKTTDYLDALFKEAKYFDSLSKQGYKGIADPIRDKLVKEIKKMQEALEWAENFKKGAASGTKPPLTNLPSWVTPEYLAELNKLL